MEMCNEMIVLRKYLDDMNILWKDTSKITTEEEINHKLKDNPRMLKRYADTTIYGTKFTHNNKHFSVVYGCFTYGGYNPHLNIDDKLLEVCYSGCSDSIGYLTAKDIINLL